MFLSASVPDAGSDAGFVRMEDAHVEIERAVVSLGRAVFSNGGRLVFGGHPSISPLVSMVAGEYGPPAREGRQPLVSIYQSRAFEGAVPDSTSLLERHGYARIVWTDTGGGEVFAPQINNRPHCPESLKAMRKAMIGQTKPVAMVAIGGMRGVRDEAEMFLRERPGRPLYAIASTGGAAAWLCRSGWNVDAIDQRLMGRLRGGNSPREREEAEEQLYRFTPYPLIMQELVADLSTRLDQSEGVRD